MSILLTFKLHYSKYKVYNTAVSRKPIWQFVHRFTVTACAQNVFLFTLPYVTFAVGRL